MPSSGSKVDRRMVFHFSCLSTNEVNDGEPEEKAEGSTSRRTGDRLPFFETMTAFSALRRSNVAKIGRPTSSNLEEEALNRYASD